MGGRRSARVGRCVGGSREVGGKGVEIPSVEVKLLTCPFHALSFEILIPYCDALFELKTAKNGQSIFSIYCWHSQDFQALMRPISRVSRHSFFKLSSSKALALSNTEILKTE